MTNYKITVNISQLRGSQRIEYNGQKGTFIPDVESNIFTPASGGAFLTLMCWEKTGGPDKKGNTHTVKQSFPLRDV